MNYKKIAVYTAIFIVLISQSCNATISSMAVHWMPNVTGSNACVSSGTIGGVFSVRIVVPKNTNDTRYASITSATIQ